MHARHENEELNHSDSTKHVEREMLKELKEGILYDASQGHVPPFTKNQQKIDQVDCFKSFLAASIFNRLDLPDGVTPINFGDIPSCSRSFK